MIRLFQFVATAAFLIAGYVMVELYVLPAREVALGTPAYAIEERMPQGLSASSWILFDAETGETLQAVDALRTRPIASVTKLLSAEVVYGDMDLDATTTISRHAVDTEGRAGSLEAGDVFTIRELLFPLLLTSSNDAAVALAEAYEGGEGAFMHAMNERAAALGMTSASFGDASGLTSASRASAEDLKVLLMYLFDARRHLLDITTLSRYAGEDIEWKNNNPVHDEYGYQGGKHGFTDEAGRTFAGVFEEELEGGKRPIGIILLESKNIDKDVGILREHARSSVAYTFRF